MTSENVLSRTMRGDKADSAQAILTPQAIIAQFRRAVPCGEPKKRVPEEVVKEETAELTSEEMTVPKTANSMMGIIGNDWKRTEELIGGPTSREADERT